MVQIPNTAQTTAHTFALIPDTVQLIAHTAAVIGDAVASTAKAIFAFEGGGVVPSAAGGMVTPSGVGGMLAILHPNEMVLPSPISQAVQNMTMQGGGGEASPIATAVSHIANLNYAPNVNMGGRGRGGSGMTRGEFSQMLALHSGSMMGEARNMVRNGWRPT